ncbi:MAG: hypothetical protein ACR2PY_08410 [Salinispira sp.]
MAKSAVEKVRDRNKAHKIVDRLPDGIPWAPNGARMVVSTPWEIYAIISEIPKGNILTISVIREYLAKKYGTDIACPVSTGMFINMSALASEELRDQGENFAPYWRVLRADGSLNPKYPEGTAAQEIALEAEGFTFKKLRKTIFVEHYEDYLWDIVSELLHKAKISGI